MTDIVFDKRQTNIAKGVALLLLLWHHLFYDNPNNYNSFVSLFYIKNIPVECFIAKSCKVCVALFLLLSGYGLFKSYSKVNNNKNKMFDFRCDIRFVKKHLIKLLVDYWIIYIIFVPIGFWLGRNPFTIYNGNIFNFLFDFLGLSNLFASPTMNPTWWFMSLIIILYIIYPLLHKAMNVSGEILLLSSLFVCVFYPLPDVSNLRIYLFPFVLGMYISKNGFFEKLSVLSDTALKRLLLPLLSLSITVWLKYTIFINSAEIDGFFALAFVLISLLIISRIPFISYAFEHLGICSGLVFMFHTFIFSYYFKDFIYSFKYSLLIFLFFTVICFVTAKLILFVKDKTVCVYRRRKNVQST